MALEVPFADHAAKVHDFQTFTAVPVKEPEEDAVLSIKRKAVVLTFFEILASGIDSWEDTLGYYKVN